MNILVTGGAGFIGSAFIRYLSEHHPDDRIVNLDLLTYAGNLQNLREVECNPNYSFVHGDIADRTLVESLMTRCEIDQIVNFAAESHVDRSITHPEEFIRSNILGTEVLLDAAKNAWKLKPDDKYDRGYRPGVKYIQVSTDEVTGVGQERFVYRTDPRSPTALIPPPKQRRICWCAWNQTFGLPVNITRCSNNYGPYQFPKTHPVNDQQLYT